MRTFRVIAGVGLVSATLFAGANSASASTSSTTTHSSNDPVRANRLADVAIPRGSKDLGAYSTSSPVDFEVVLSSSNPTGELALAQAEYTASSPLYHHWLTPSQFDAEFGPSSATVDSTVAWLQGQGLTAKRSSEFGLSVSAPSSQVARALGVSFESYRFDGRVGHAPRSAPLVPQGVLGQVDGILGLNTMQLPEQHSSARVDPKAAPASPTTAAARPRATGGCTEANTAAVANTAETMLTEASTFGVTQLWNNGLLGQGQTVGVYELAGYQPSDISTYEQCFGLSNPVTAVGTAATDLQLGGTSEADLDIEEVAQQAPGASILVYQADQSGDPSVPYDLYNKIVSADAVQTVTSSWGECEPDDNVGGTSYETSVNALMEQATLQGQSMLAAAGDSGSEDCAYDYILDNTTTSPWSVASVDFPGASPWVTSVGGTQFANETCPQNSSCQNYFAPSAGPASTAVTQGNLYPWNFCNGAPAGQDQGANSPCELYGGGYGAGGGGVSSFETSPSWQQLYFTDAGYSAGRGCGSVCREAPDVSGNAGYPMISYGPDPNNNGTPDFNAGYGTSYASPFMAGEVADRNSGCWTSTGNFGAVVYGLSQTTNGYQAAFTDVVQGDNDMLNTYNGADYPAKTGYDMATGLGVPVPVGIACPSVTSIAGGLTSAVAGSHITLNGIGLEDASIYFGKALAPDYGTPTATSVTVTVPQVDPSGAPTQVYISGAVNGVGGKQLATVPITVTGTGAAATCASATGMPLQGAIGIAAVTINGCPGYFVADAEGRVAAFGSATTHGDLSQVHLGSPIVGITATADGEGYYMFAARGGIFTYGDAAFHGAAVQYGPKSPVIGLAVVPDGSGYWMVTSAGGMFTFGGAHFYGAATTYGPKTPISGMAVAPGGAGYWIVTQAGGVFSFGSAPFEGTRAPSALVVGVTGTPDGRGYTLVDRTGKVYNLGDAANYGQPSGVSNVIDLSPTPADNGYYEVTSGGGVLSYGPGTTYFGRV